MTVHVCNPNQALHFFFNINTVTAKLNYGHQPHKARFKISIPGWQRFMTFQHSIIVSDVTDCYEHVMQVTVQSLMCQLSHPMDTQNCTETVYFQLPPETSVYIYWLWGQQVLKAYKCPEIKCVKNMHFISTVSIYSMF